MTLRIYGNRPIQTLPGKSTRPTPARVREAVFNIWQGSIADCSWLDLCAGNGTMGAEALCRGAKQVIGIEKSPRACQIIRQNWQQLAQSEQEFQVIKGEVLRSLDRLTGQQFDHIYFDPPYRSQLYQPVLQAIAQNHLLTSAGELIAEHDPKQWHPTAPAGLTLNRVKTYGNTALALYCHSLEGYCEKLVEYTS